MTMFPPTTDQCTSEISTVPEHVGDAVVLGLGDALTEVDNAVLLFDN
jgi:hypothetical protein